MTLKLGLIGYGAIGKHVEAALKAGNIENLELVAALVKRPRNEGLLTHEPDRFFAHEFDAVAECAGHEAVRAFATGEKPLAGRSTRRRARPGTGHPRSRPSLPSWARTVR